MKTYTLLLILLFTSCNKGNEYYELNIYKKEIDFSKKEVKYYAKRNDGKEITFQTEKYFEVGDDVKVSRVFNLEVYTKK